MYIYILYIMQTKSIAVFTILIGSYDSENEIKDIYKEEEIDYYYITDNRSLKVNGYTMIYVDIMENNKKMTQRYYKLLIPDFIKNQYKRIYLKC